MPREGLGRTGPSWRLRRRRRRRRRRRNHLKLLSRSLQRPEVAPHTGFCSRGWYSTLILTPIFREATRVDRGII